MALTRSEMAGLAIAAVGHAALFVLLAGYFLPAPNPDKLVSTPIEVSITDESALVSQAPVVSHEEVAAKLSPVEAPPEPEAAPPEPQPDPQPIAKPQPTPPKPAPAAASAKQPAKRDVRASGALDGIVAGLASQPTKGKATTPPAATAGPAVRSALAAEIIRQIKPHWTPPSGADTDQLRTKVTVQLNQDGSLASELRVTQTGITDSNRSQAALARERAVRAVRLAAPFKLPAQYYDAWKTIAPVLYEDL